MRILAYIILNLFSKKFLCKPQIVQPDFISETRTVAPQSSEINGGDCVWGPQRGGDWDGDGGVRA